MNLRDKISQILSYHDESWADVAAHTLSDQDLNCEWDIHEFELWTVNRVYHVEHDAEEGAYITSVSRNPPASLMALKPEFSIPVIQRIRKALKDDAAGNCDCTMTDLDFACEMLDQLIKLKK